MSSYPLVSRWWNTASEYYSNAKNSESQTLAKSVVFAERLAAPALRGLSKIPEYCPEGIVEVVDGVAVRQLESAENLVQSSTSYALSTKDAAVSRTSEMVSNSATYISSTGAAVQEAAASSYEGSRKAFTSRVDQWRKTLRESFVFGEKRGSGEEVAPSSSSSSPAKSLTPFDRVATVFPGLIHCIVILDRLMFPLQNCYDGARKRYEYTLWMARHGVEQLQEAQDKLCDRYATAASVRETARSRAIVLLNNQRSFLETLRESVSSRGADSDSVLLRQLNHLPSFVFDWSTKTIDFSDGVLAWTHDYVAPSELPSSEE